MPIYEYCCPNCGKTFEEWLKTSDDSSTRPCPACGTPSPHILSNTSFLLKGGGWFVNHEAPKSADSPTAPASSADAPATSAGNADASGAKSEGQSGKADVPAPAAASAASDSGAGAN